MRLSKYWSVLIVLVIMALLVSACGGGGDAADEQATDTQASQSTEAETTETTDEDSDVSSEDEAAAPVMETSLVGELEGPEIITELSQYPDSLNEAPMLADLVAAGELPPLEERLPAISELLVIEPVQEIGKYGGTWRRGFTGPADGQNGHRVAAGDRFLFWHSTRFPEMVPNLAKGWEFDNDGKTLRIFLREGIRWSDGEPFDANDVLFWWDNIYHNEEIVPVRSPFISIAGEELTLTKVDDFTIQFDFSVPNTLFLEVLGSSINVFGGQAIFGGGGNGGYAPEHYVSQFLPGFGGTEDELNAKAEADGFDNWVNWFKDKSTWQRNPDLPVLTPWKTEVPITTPNWVLVRNPYYFGVDTAGNQLPYIDRISMGVVENLEVLNLRAIAGEYDYQARHVSLANVPVLLENAEQAGYTVSLDPAQHGADGAFRFNMSYNDDPYIGDLIREKDFRRALSLAVDRDKINEIVFLGIGVAGSHVVAESSVYNPGSEYRDLWSTFEPDQANQMLDDLGLTERDSDGYRLRADNGERITLELITVPAFIQFTAIAELMKEDWVAIGIDATISEQERGLWSTRNQNNELMVNIWQNDGSDELFLYPGNAFPVIPGQANGPLYGLWRATGGAEGMEPHDPDIKRLHELFDQAPAMTQEERIEAGKEIWRMAADGVWTLGTVGQSGAFMGVRVVKNNMGNIPSRQLNIQAGQTPNISRPSTFFFTDIE